MPVDARTPLSPGWWLARLGHQLVTEQTQLRRLWDYVTGDPPLPSVPGVDPHDVREWMATGRANWLGLVVDAVRERLLVGGFRFGTDAGADTDANEMWQANALDSDSAEVHYTALAQRRGFVMVGPPPPGQRWPLITPEHPSQVTVEFEPGQRRAVRAGLKLFRDDWTAQTRATVYQRGWLHRFVARSSTPRFGSGLTVPSQLAGWDHDQDGEQRNPLGAVPIVPFVNRATTKPMLGMAEFEDVTPIQDRINLTLIDLIAAMRYGAFRQRWAAGLEVETDPITGKEIEPFKLDIRKLWHTESETTKFGEFQSTDLTGYIKAVQDAVRDLAAISRTPAHYLLSDMVNGPSGDALQIAETGLVMKVRDRMTHFGEGWEQVIRLGFRWLGDARANLTTAETIWRDPESRTLAERADAVAKLKAADVPWRERMEIMGFTPQQIARMESDRAVEQLQALALGAVAPAAPAQPPAGAAPELPAAA